MPDVAAIRFHKVGKCFGTVSVIHDLNLVVKQGELLALLGRSGCGKTTLLRLINGLETADKGEITIQGQAITGRDVIQLRRGIGYVIQEAGLLPHLNIADNIALLGRVMGHPRGQRMARARDLMDMVYLDPLQMAERFPSELSGGQQQRVGVARSLYLDPPILLLDEPFGALDPMTRHKVQEEFLRLKAQLGKTMVLVTHDVDEAVRLADRIAVVDRGRILQIGTPSELISQPADEAIASLFQPRRRVL